VLGLPPENMKPLIRCGLILWAASNLSSFAADAALDQAIGLEEKGDFRGAAKILRTALEEKRSQPRTLQQVAFELERLERIRKDFSLTREELFTALQEVVRELTATEFDRWIREGRFDSREIDGEQRFMVSSVSNLFFRYSELDSRRKSSRNPPALQDAHWRTSVTIKRAAIEQGKPYVLPKRFEVTMTVTAKAGLAAGEGVIRAWLPVPREYPFQGGFEMISASPAITRLDSAKSPIRAAYMERQARPGADTEFRLVYQYTAQGVWFDLAAPPIGEAKPDPAVEVYTREAPHVVFTPEIRGLSRRIAHGETNRVRLARAFYEWISANIKYSYAIEYSTIRNISDYCRSRGYGDCGQEALLFITLCRLNGIPARWQSGWNTFPEAKSIHDWSEIYLEPWGWVPVDPYMGIYATQYAGSLTPQQREELRSFYFGGLDQYRIAANSDHCQQLTPPKKFFRSDTVDFQRGELETEKANLYFDQFSYHLEAREIGLQP
jgi:transglutaminase-like putative cysteine protease